MDNETINSTSETEVKEESVVPKEEVAPEVSKDDGPTPVSIFSGFKFEKNFYIVIVALVALIAGVFFYNSQDTQVAIKQFTNVYSFVPEKISKSAPIQINLPEGVEETVAREAISFSPEVEGSWKVEDVEGVVVFEPKTPLKSGVYYAVNMDTGTIQMSGDFYVDEDPQIEAIFPIAGSETPEDTEITIVFNRPMVPLTTLEVQESVDIPITITPETSGKFKWISTRNLQFVPETTLIPSSDYTIEIKSGLYSLDGLPIAPVTHNFVTRPLRYEFVSNGQIGYRSPIIINFNQPVDLEKTKKQIFVTSQEGGSLNINVEYGETTYYDHEARKYVTEEDRSKLFVYQKKDKHGRSDLWDFDTTYGVTLRGAVPLFGTKDLTEGRNSNVHVPTIVENTSAQSERSNLVRPDFLDPEGTLTVTFYEDVDKDASDINVKGLRDIQYGERCKVDEQGNQIRVGSRCEKEADKKNLIFSFNRDVFSTNESFDLVLEQMVTPDGFKINREPINITLKTYSTFQILRTLPPQGSASAALDGMYVCSNSPLKDPNEEEGVSSYIKTEGYIVFGRWYGSRYLEYPSTYNHCEVGEFETEVNYGILPETYYEIRLSLIDAFDQTNDRNISFTSESPKEQYTRFYNMQKQYNVTPPGRTSLTYAVENLESVNMHICSMQPETFLERTEGDEDRFDPPTNVGCNQVVTKTISLPPRYWVNNYFQIDLADHFTDTRGHYVITFSSPLYKDSYSGKPLYDRTFVSVTNLAVGKKVVEYSEGGWSVSNNPVKDKVLEEEINTASNLYWVNDSQSLTPVLGAVVTQYSGGYKREFKKEDSGYTNGQGIAKTNIREGLVGAVVRSGLDTAVISNWADTLRDTGYTRDASRTYIYTDRPIYRPGQTVHIKGIDRIGFDGTYEVWNKEPVKLEVFDSRGASVYETTLEVNDYGTFETEFEIPSDGSLGTYRVKVFGQGTWFSVEEYVPAAFKIETESNKEEYVNGDLMKLEVQADYYFGVPLSEGTVSYSVTAQDYYFDRYTDEYFNFGRSWYYCYYCGYGDDFLFRGEASLNEKGRAVIERELNFKDFFDDASTERSKLITVSITAKDINGRSVSTQRSFVVHKGDFYIGAKTDRYYTGVNSPLTLRVKTVDTKGKPIALKNIERTLYKVNWETYKRQEVDGGFYYRSEKTLEEVSSEKIDTDKNGDWSGQLTFAEEGQYELKISKTDERGNNIETTSNIYIYGSRSIAVPPNNNYELDLEVEKSSLDVGDTASLLIKSPYDKAKALITVERGTVYDYWIVDITGGLYLHEFPIKSEYAPNIFVSALLLSEDPEVKYGSVRYEIGYDEKELSVKVSSDKTHYLPGEEVTLTVETRDHTGKLVPAEVSLAVADLSVLALKGNPKKNPALFFFDGFPLSVSTASNIKNILYEVDIPLGTKGGGGGDPDDLAKKKRGVFKDTAYWEASVETGAGGKAVVSFTLPDNLTTWQIESLGITKDTKLGVDYAEFTTKKDLMAVPLKPRFVVPGDTFSLGAKVFNQTDKGATVNVKLESETLIFTGPQEDSVFISEGESKTVYFEVTAPGDIRAGEHVFNFTASADSFIDSVDQVISITPNKTYETVATANFTKEDKATEYIYVPSVVEEGEGGLTINANATMAVFMTDALSYMVTYPYGCSEQLASSLSTIGILTEALSLPNVEGEFDTIEHDGVVYTVEDVVKDGLSQIYETQTGGGGFTYYKGLYPSLPLTLHVVSALGKLRDAGFEVREDVIRRGSAYIESETKSNYYRTPAYYKEAMVLAEYVLRTTNGGAPTSLTSIVETLINDSAFVNEKISSMSLAYLSIITADGFGRSARDQVYTALQNRIDIDGRGSYLSTNDAANKTYFETPVKDTALLLKAFAAHEDEHVAMGNVLRWLLASRDKNGVWGGTNNTFVVVDAMIDYLKWQHETESHFSIRGLLDGVEIFGYEFNPKTVFETFTHFVPINELAREKLQTLVFERENHNEQKNNLYYDIALKYFLPVESLPPRDEGITITRGLYSMKDLREEDPLTSAEVGEVIRGKLTITTPDQYTHVAVEDMIPAGFEIVNFNLETEDQSLRDYENQGKGERNKLESETWLSRIGNIFGTSQAAQIYGYWGGFGGSYGNNTRKLYTTHTESHDDRVFLYIENLAPGVYEYEYFLRALVPGEFQHLPARAEELYFPEVFGRTGGEKFTITPAR